MRIMGLFLGALLALPVCGQPPNILLILTDDQGWPTLGSYGNRRAATPRLDRLAAEGLRFTDAYALPQCTPTRAALLTGQHSARNGMWHVIPWYGTPWAPVAEPAFRESFSRDQFTVAKGLQAVGYRTAIVGKWHLTANADGNYVGLNPGAAEHYGFDFSAPPPSPRYHQETDKGVDWLTDQVVAFIQEQRDRPWFCYLSHHTLHGPVLAPGGLVQRKREEGAPETGLHNATYLAAIEHLDSAVGRLLDRLEELGEAEETVVLFFSDNGGVYQECDIGPFKDGPGTARELVVAHEEFSNAPLRAGKGSPYEGGIRVPLIVRWPGVIPPGSVNRTPVHVVDLFPTFLELAGARPPAGHVVDGVSLAPLWKGQALAERALLWYLPLYDLRWAATPCAVIRRGDWKLIEYFGDRFDAEGRYREGAFLELFNLRTDLAEQHNRSADEPDRAAALRHELHGLIEACGAPLPGANPHADPTRRLKEVRDKPAFLADPPGAAPDA